MFKLYYKLLGDLSVYYQIYGNYAKARELAEKSVKNDGGSVKALNLYGILLLEEGRAEEALSCLTKARQINKNPVVEKHLAVSIGSCYWKLGDIKKGIETIEEITGKFDYINPDVYTNLGFLYMLENEYVKAEEYSKKALEVSENHAPAYDNLGQIYFRTGKTEEAAQSFEKALELNSRMTDSKYYLGLIYEERGETEKARELFTSAHGDFVNALNTVSKEQIEEKYEKYKI